MASPSRPGPARRMASAHWWLLAFGWGLAEATIFFVVPDVLLTWISVQVGRRTAMIASVFAALGAAIGGALLLWWMEVDAPRVITTVIALPGIDDAMLAAVREDVADDWFRALVIGAFSGIPYKLFAISASEMGLPAPIFLFASLLARIPRFLLAVLAANLIASRLRQSGRAAWVRPLWFTWWLGFYTFYFHAMGL